MRTPEYRENDPRGNLLLYLNSRRQLPAIFDPSILPMLKSQKTPKTLIVAKPGQILNTAYWLEDAYGYAYKIVYDHKDLPIKKILQIFAPKSIMLDPSGFFQNEPCQHFIAIVKATTFIPFSLQNFIELRQMVPEVEGLANCILSEIVAQGRTRMEIQELKGIGRYEELIKRFGIQILQCFPQRDLSRFLGYAPEYISGVLKRDPKQKRA